MHTKQWLSSEQKYHSRTRFAGMWRDMAVWVSYGGINIGGRIKQSFYPRTRHGELKVISMIYAPPYLIRRRRSEGEVDRSRTRNVSDDNPGAHKTATLESKQRCTTITTEQTRSEGITRHGNVVRNYRRERLLTA